MVSDDAAQAAMVCSLQANLDLDLRMLISTVRLQLLRLRMLHDSSEVCGVNHSVRQEALVSQLSVNYDVQTTAAEITSVVESDVVAARAVLALKDFRDASALFSLLTVGSEACSALSMYSCFDLVLCPGDEESEDAILSSSMDLGIASVLDDMPTNILRIASSLLRAAG